LVGIENSLISAVFTSDLLPATEEEYNEYIKSKVRPAW